MPQVLENFIPPLLDAVLLDYQRTPVPSAREPEVLSTITAIVNKLGDSVTPQVGIAGFWWRTTPRVMQVCTHSYCFCLMWKNVPLRSSKRQMLYVTFLHWTCWQFPLGPYPILKLISFFRPQVPKIFDAVFECTLNMINKDFEEFPEHRTNFFSMLQSVNQHCFGAFVAIPAAQFKLVLDSVIWAVKHTMRNVSETGLQVGCTLGFS